MKCFVFMVAWAIITNAWADEVVYGELGGKRIAAVVPLAVLEQQPPWDGDKHDTPPVSAAQALRLSRLALEQKHPSLTEDRTRFRSLELRTCSRQTEKVDTGDGIESQEVFIGNCWLYVIRYRYAPPSDGPEYQNLIPVVVLMDGSTFVADSLPHVKDLSP